MTLMPDEREMIVDFLARYYAEHWTIDTGIPEDLCYAMFRKVPWTVGDKAFDALTDDELLQKYLDHFEYEMVDTSIPAEDVHPMDAKVACIVMRNLSVFAAGEEPRAALV